VERDNTIAYYYQVAETLKGRIESREYPPGGLLPSEKDLSAEFGVSNITIRKAMSLLVKQGLVVRRRGVGTRVLETGDQRIPLRITGNFGDWVDSALSRRQKLTIEVLDMETVPCPHPVATALGRPPGSDIWRLRRIRMLKDEPISYYINYTPLERMQNVRVDDFREKNFIEVFQAASAIAIDRIEQRVEATTADMDVAAVLRIDFGAPLFFITNIYSPADGGPVEITHMFFRGDRYIYRNVSSLTNG